MSRLSRPLIPYIRHSLTRYITASSSASSSSSSSSTPPIQPLHHKTFPSNNHPPTLGSSVAPVPSPHSPLPSPTPPSIPPPSPGCPSHILTIHSHLSLLPQLDPSTLYAGPPLPRPYEHFQTQAELRPRGKRGRGSRDAGQGVGEPGGFWRWVVVVQVREGTKGRGSVEAVLRSLRVLLSKQHPSLPLPPRTRKQAEDGWAMLDLGDTAVHILSRTARDKWFTDNDLNPEEEGLKQVYGGMPFWFKTYTE